MGSPPELGRNRVRQRSLYFNVSSLGKMLIFYNAVNNMPEIDDDQILMYANCHYLFFPRHGWAEMSEQSENIMISRKDYP